MKRVVVMVLAGLTLTGCLPSAEGGLTTGGSAQAPERIEQRKAAGIAECPALPAQKVVDYGLPEVDLECLGGDTKVSLASLRGKPMLINVWAQWCPPCRAEAKPLAEFAGKAGDKVRIIGIDYNDPDPAKALEFAALSGWRYPQLYDPQGSISEPMKVRGIPQTILVDADGRVVYRHSGGLESSEQIVDLVNRHLKAGV